ncbi:MAG: arginyl-tRNA synthetase [Protaetiibacter sp.]
MRRPLLLVSSASALLVAGALLAGCTTPVPQPTPSGSTPSGDASPSTSATPSDSPSAPSSTPVDIACDALVTPQAMYDFNPNFSLLAAWKPAAGTPAAAALDAQGVACRWQNDTSGETIDVSVASLDQAALEAKAADAGSSASYGFFRVTAGAGEATAIDGPYWVVVRSSYFAAADDAQELVAAAVSALP